MIFGNRHDEQFSGVVPGVVPPGADAPTERCPGVEWKGEVAVQFHPPAKVGPALAGTVLDGRVDPRDLGALMIDLSLRGWFQIRKTEDDDWQLLRQRPVVAGELEPHEVLMLQALFPGSTDEVMLSAAKQRLARPLRQVRDSLYASVVEHGWYRRHPSPGRLEVLVRGRSPRTATGTAVRVQTLGFQKYLATAEADQIKFEEAADQFSRYLPYAMVFGLAQRWAGVIGEVVRKAQLEDAAAVSLEFASDPMAWYFLDGLVDLADLGIGALDLDSLFGDGSLFDLGDVADLAGDAFDGLGEVVGGIFDSLDF